MGLTYPIDTVDPREIPDLAPLFDAGASGDMVRYVVYRFDPGSKEVRGRQVQTERDGMAAQMCKYIPTDADKSLLPKLTTCYLRIINSMDYTVLTSLEIAHDEATQLIREKIEDDDPDKKLKAVELKQKVIAGLSKMEDEISVRLHKIAKQDQDAIAALVADAPKRKGQRFDVLTGKPFTGDADDNGQG